MKSGHSLKSSNPLLSPTNCREFQGVGNRLCLLALPPHQKLVFIMGHLGRRDCFPLTPTRNESRTVSITRGWVVTIAFIVSQILKQYVRAFRRDTDPSFLFQSMPIPYHPKRNQLFFFFVTDLLQEYIRDHINNVLPPPPIIPLLTLAKPLPGWIFFGCITTKNWGALFFPFDSIVLLSIFDSPIPTVANFEVAI